MDSQYTSKNFKVVNRPWGHCWKHKTQACWIVFYKTLEEAGKPCFSAYRAIEGNYQHKPWTSNNRCIGRFNTLNEAMAFIDNIKEQQNHEKLR